MKLPKWSRSGRRTGKQMLEGERDKLLRMEDVLHDSVVGQQQAIAAVSNAVRRSPGWPE